MFSPGWVGGPAPIAGVLTLRLDRLPAPPGTAANVNINPIESGYYSTRALNPKDIAPARPALARTLARAA